MCLASAQVVVKIRCWRITDTQDCVAWVKSLMTDLVHGRVTHAMTPLTVGIDKAESVTGCDNAMLTV